MYLMFLLLIDITILLCLSRGLFWVRLSRLIKDFYTCNNVLLHQFPRFTQHNLAYLPVGLDNLRRNQQFLVV